MSSVDMSFQVYEGLVIAKKCFNFSGMSRDLEVASVELWELGFTVFPFLVFRDREGNAVKFNKEPVAKGYLKENFERLKKGDQTLTDLNRVSWTSANAVAIMNGVKLRDSPYYVCTVDIDDPNIIGDVLSLFPETYRERTPSGGLHLLYLSETEPEPAKILNEEGHEVLSVRANGQWTVIYPSEFYGIDGEEKTVSIVKDVNYLVRVYMRENGLYKPSDSEYQKYHSVILDNLKKELKQLIKRETEDRIDLLCPFHEETHPSFSIYLNDEKALYVDFHDNSKGNLKELVHRLVDEGKVTEDLLKLLIEVESPKYELIGDEFDPVMERIANHPKMKEVIDIIDTKKRVTISDIIVPLREAIRDNIKLVKVRYNSVDYDLFYIDPHSNLLRGLASEFFKIVHSRILEPNGYSNEKLVSRLVYTFEGLTGYTVQYGELDNRAYTPLGDGVLDNDTLDFLTYEEAFKENIIFSKPLKVPVKYDAGLIRAIKAGDFDLNRVAPNFSKILKRFFDKENLELLEDLMGYIISPKRGKRRIGFIVGPPNTGKSTLLEILKGLLGKRMVSASSDTLQARFGRSVLRGAWVVASSERPKNTINNDLFKRMSGGDTIEVEEKHKPIFEILVQALLLFVMNELPEFNNIDDATLERIVIVHTQNPLSKDEIEDDLIFKILKEEGEGIFYWLVNCYWKLKAKNYNIEKDDELIKELLTRAKSNVIKFKEDMLELEPYTYVKGTELYEAYNRWCLEKGEEPLGRNKFYEHVTTYIPGVVRTTKQTALYFQGIHIIGDSGDSTEEKIDNLEGAGQEALAKGDFEKFDEIQAKVPKPAKGHTFKKVVDEIREKYDISEDAGSDLLRGMMELGMVEINNMMVLNKDKVIVKAGDLLNSYLVVKGVVRKGTVDLKNIQKKIFPYTIEDIRKLERIGWIKIDKGQIKIMR